MTLAHAVAVVWMQFPVSDPVRSAQVAEMVLNAWIAEHESHDRQRISSERRRFEEKFNALVKAVEGFSKKYNEGKGHVWPKREADALQKALIEFRKVQGFSETGKRQSH